MSWAPTPKDLEAFDFTNSTYPNSFLVRFLGSEEVQIVFLVESRCLVKI